MQLLRDLILVKPCPSEEQTEGGLFIPESARERSSRAVIVEVGNGTKKEPMQYKKGDMVIHIKGAGDNEEFILGGETHYLIRQIDILSFVTNN
jgi:chaperonin GroES